MNESFKFTTRIIKKASSSFIKINVFGQFLILLISIIGLIILFHQNPEETANLSFIETAKHLFSTRTIGFSLSILALIVSPIVVFILGNKYIISKIIHFIIVEKGDKLIFPIVDVILKKIHSIQPNLIQKGSDKVLVKLKILQEIKESSENRWIKKVLHFAFSKVELNDVDFKDENNSFSEIIKIKVFTILKDISEPSRMFYGIILGINVILLLCIVFKIL